MRLAFCLFDYFPYGGLQRDFFRIAQACQQRGHEIHVYTMRWQDKVPAKFALHILEKKGRTNHQRAWNFAQQLQNVLVSTRYDRVIGFNKLPDLDIYFAADNCVAEKIRGIKRYLPRYQIYQKLEAAVFAPEAKTRILTLTPQQQQSYQQHYHTPVKRFHLLPPGIDPEFQHIASAQQQRQQLRDAYQVNAQQKILLMVCSYFHTKGVDRVLHALAALPEGLRAQTQLWIAGGDNPAPYQKLANKLHITAHIRFLGAQISVLPFYLASDLFIHPARHEAAGMVLLEALATGLPVLTTENCGYHFYIQAAQAGMVLPLPFHQTQLNDALSNMLMAQQNFWQENARNYVAHHSLFGLTDNAVAFIEEIQP